MQFNTKDKELTLKIVYYGPALSGKTTNIQALHQLLDASARGRLMTLDTKGDRTLFFDLLPMHFSTRSGWKVKIKLFTVPGQVVHEATRRIVLSGRRRHRVHRRRPPFGAGEQQRSVLRNGPESQSQRP